MSLNGIGRRTRARSLAGSLIIAIVLMAGGAKAGTASANQDFECHLEFSSKNAIVELCTASDHRGWVKLSWRQKEGAPPTVIKALFPADSDRLWQRISISGTDVIDKNAQLKLRREIFEYGPQNLHPRAHAVLDFFANFAPPGTSLKGFDQSFTDHLLAERVGPWYQMICESLGKAREAVFQSGNLEVRKAYTVGDAKSSCPGRCGIGCSQLFQWRANQYTQECLNHDACTDMNGSALGTCQWLFVEAAFGYLLAPNCESPAPNPAPAQQNPPVQANPGAKSAAL